MLRCSELESVSLRDMAMPPVPMVTLLMLAARRTSIRITAQVLTGVAIRTPEFMAATTAIRSSVVFTAIGVDIMAIAEATTVVIAAAMATAVELGTRIGAASVMDEAGTAAMAIPVAAVMESAALLERAVASQAALPEGLAEAAVSMAVAVVAN